jgi:glycine betaine/choline ABC-type transport system substrate-binding protein
MRDDTSSSPNAAPVIHARTLRKWPVIAELLNSITARL